MKKWCLFEPYFQSAQVLCIREDFSRVSFQAFWQDVRIQSAEIKKLHHSVWALWEKSSYDFLVLLFAALQAGKEVLLPPHRIRDLEQELAEQNIYFLSRQQQVQQTDLFDLSFDDDFLHQAKLYFYTSGSTGQPKRIPRTLKQLLNEVEGLNDSFELPSEVSAIATVSHQHIYGLLFKLFWPLISGRSFFEAQIAFPEDVIALQIKLSECGIQNYLISSPALLKRWTSDLRLQHCTYVYSSGGKLESGVRSLLNVGIFEIFGSSETGGIAYRYQDHDVWTPFANVEIQAQADHELAVKSNHAFTSDWILTGDQIEVSLPNNVKSSFKLLGRLDRLVKLEEKRISLDAIEQKLIKLPFVEQCHVLVLEQDGRQRLASIMVLNSLGRTALHEKGKAKFVAELKATLIHQLETIAIPKQWRFLAKLPQNAQSKLNKHYMKSLFNSLTLPVVLEKNVIENGHEYQLEFIPELECFKGHFPKQPIYPGVGQIAFIQHFSKENWVDLQWCNGYEQLKFQDLIQPFMQVSLSLKRQDHKVSFELKTEEKTLASGRLLFDVNSI